jgi:hypothetical protein
MTSLGCVRARARTRLLLLQARRMTARRPVWLSGGTRRGARCGESRHLRGCPHTHTPRFATSSLNLYSEELPIIEQTWLLLLLNNNMCGQCGRGLQWAHGGVRLNPIDVGR